jgi:GT2 family glycosyltransferase
MNKIGLIIALHNQKQHLRAMLDSLLLQSESHFKIYLIDNNSSDGSELVLKEYKDSHNLDFSYTRLNANTGYAGGTNSGARLAIKDACEYLFILNPDVILHKDCIRELISLITSDNNIVCTGPLILRHYKNTPDIIQEYGGKVNFRKGTLKKFYAGKNINKVELPVILETDFISGGACMIRSEIFQKAGMLEESYFAYFDEIDLYHRIDSLGKFKKLVTSKAILWHNHDWSPSNPIAYYVEYYLAERNKYLYFYRFNLYISIFVTALVDIVKFPVRFIWFKKVCNYKLSFYYLKGMLHGLFKVKGKPGFIS